MKNATRIGLAGAGGKMGRMLVAEIAATDAVELVGGCESPDSPLLGRDLGELAGLGHLDIRMGGDSVELFRHADVVIDFTRPAASVAHARHAAEAGRELVIGTTGIDASGARVIAEAAKRAPIVWAPNMSLGINLLLAVVEDGARRLGPDWDIEVLEMHHRHKVDAPSGTALALGLSAASGRGVDLEAVSQRVRNGHTGPRRAGDIGFATLRGGDVVGDHTVIFAAPGERIELAHKANSRQIYARGAVRAALWVAAKPPGLYGMKDVLGI